MKIDLSDPKTFVPFDGDGRKRMRASAATQDMYPECNFQPCTVAAARRVIEMLVQDGRLCFGKEAVRLWIGLVWCSAMKLAYRVIDHPVSGWHIVVDTHLVLAKPQVQEDPVVDDPFSGDELSDGLKDYYRSLYGSDLDNEDINQLARRLRC